VLNTLSDRLSLEETDEICGNFDKEQLSIKVFPLKIYKDCVLWTFEKMHLPKYAFKPFSTDNLSQQPEIIPVDNLVFRESPTGIAILSHSNKLLKFNRAFGLISGLKGRELVDKTLEDLLTPESIVKVKARFEANRDQTRPQVPLDIVLKDAPDKAINLYYSLPTNEGGECKRIIHFIDSSEQKKLEAQFVQSQKMQAIGQLAGGVAHDFNNLLTAMIGFCDLLLLRHVPGDQSFSDIMHIKQNANRAATLVRQLLAFSRQQTLQSKVINVNDAIADLCVLMRRLLGVNVELKIVHSPHIGSIKADLGQIEQVLVNLSVNARDAMPEGGTLTIRTLPYQVLEPLEMDNEIIPPGKYVSIEIEDTGEGITKENLSRIFEPFFSTKPVGKGTGLGLATVYGIVKQTGGFIKVESHINKGSIFRLFLPQHQESSKHIETMEEHKDKISGDLSGFASILLVEDEEAVRMFGSRALRDKGYQVFEASCGEEALEFITTTKEKIDLIITDVVMPRVDGPALVNELKKRDLNFKVIFISGYMEDSFRQQLTSEDNVHFLLKPFNLRDFALKVKSVLEGKE
jgi:two-component system cell cycle sensor histidine kinase/response regulator CckA